jgi:hypothetical protein
LMCVSLDGKIYCIVLPFLSEQSVNYGRPFAPFRKTAVEATEP